MKLGDEEGSVCAFSGSIHWRFAVIVWILIQVGVHDVWLNPIPFLIGSLFPDCDCRTAPIGRIFPLWLIFNHRGFTHTIGGILVFTFPVVYYMGLKWGILFAGGYLLHLMMDSGTPMGIKWMTGHKRKKKRAFC